MLDENELLFDELYEKTKDCGRTQFIRLLMSKERENKQLKHILDELENWLKSLQEYYLSVKEKYDYSDEHKFAKDVLDKIKELRGIENE